VAHPRRVDRLLREGDRVLAARVVAAVSRVQLSVAHDLAFPAAAFPFGAPAARRGGERGDSPRRGRRTVVALSASIIPAIELLKLLQRLRIVGRDLEPMSMRAKS
jgi:hypothetical protein